MMSLDGALGAAEAATRDARAKLPKPQKHVVRQEEALLRRKKLRKCYEEEAQKVDAARALFPKFRDRSALINSFDFCVRVVCQGRGEAFASSSRDSSADTRAAWLTDAEFDTARKYLKNMFEGSFMKDTTVTKLRDIAASAAAGDIKQGQAAKKRRTWTRGSFASWFHDTVGDTHVGRAMLTSGRCESSEVVQLVAASKATGNDSTAGATKRHHRVLHRAGFRS